MSCWLYTWRQWVRSFWNICNFLGPLGVWPIFLSYHVKLLTSSGPLNVLPTAFLLFLLEHSQHSLYNRCLLSWEPKTIDLIFSFLGRELKEEDLDSTAKINVFRELGLASHLVTACIHSLESPEWKAVPCATELWGQRYLRPAPLLCRWGNSFCGALLGCPLL